MSETSTRAPTGPSNASGLISASALMAAGTLTSRILGFGRLMLLVLLFGNGTRQADMFTFANTVPNSMYILLAGGVLNTVLVPQIVRAIKSDADGGEAYTNRIMTAGLLILGAITIALTFAAPLIIGLYTPAGWHTAARAAQYDSMVMLAYYCLPQVFFYGAHVLAGQVLNARDKFGPMMWAPIANNVISILVLVTYLVVFGQGDKVSAFGSSQELLLGLGSTLGIAAQATVLVPFLRAAGYRFRPRFDFRNTGLGHTLRLAKWTLGFVLVTQAALVVVYRLAGSATANGQGAGLTVYSNAYAVWILPHSLITVSLATAMLPAASRLAAAGDLPGVRSETMRTMRLAVTALLPTAVALFALGQPIAQFAFGFGRGATDAHLVGWALMALTFGLVPFTVQYVCLRAYYSLEDTRTTFLLQLLISGMHVVFALTAVTLLPQAALVATGLAVAYAAAYTVGVVVSFRVLARRLPGLSGVDLLRHCVRLLLAALPAGLLAYGTSRAFAGWSDSRGAQVLALVSAGLVAVPVFLVLARLLRIGEVNEIVTTLTRRRPGRGTALADRDTGLDNPPGDGGDPGSLGDSTHPVVSQLDAGDQTEPRGIVAADSGPVLEEPTTTLVTPVAASIPAGTVLAQRYRLEELLAGAESTVTWRAFDQMLSRSVLVHLLPPLDPGAAALLSAARKASIATDSRFVRVLDAVYSQDRDLGSYIVCEYATGQSLEVILRQGPLSGLEAAWVTREVADALSGVHQHGLYHRRVDPSTVIVTPTGNVKIVGLLIEATLRPHHATAAHAAQAPELVDVLDLGRLLYAALVARWPGGPAFGMPDAPVVGRGWMTPRQVRAGVSPALDAVCDQILGDPPRHRAPQLRTANDVVNAVTKLLGNADASSDLERRLRQPVPRVPSERPAPVSSLLTQQDDVTQRIDVLAPGPGGTPTKTMAVGDLSSSGGPTTRNAARAGTHLGHPAMQAEAAQTTLIRQPPPPSIRTAQGLRSRPASRSVSQGGRRRTPRPVAVVVALVVLLVTSGVTYSLVHRDRSSGVAPGPAGTSTSTAGPSPAQRAALAIEDGRDFDPQGDPDRENPGLVRYAYDGKPKTRWETVTYYRNPKFGGLKRGVGLVLDLGRPQPVASVTLTLSGKGTGVEVRVPKGDAAQVDVPPLSSDSRWRTVSDEAKVKGTATLDLPEPVSTRFVLVYLTSLPKEGSGYRGGIYEVELHS